MPLQSLSEPVRAVLRGGPESRSERAGSSPLPLAHTSSSPLALSLYERWTSSSCTSTSPRRRPPSPPSPRLSTHLSQLQPAAGRKASSTSSLPPASPSTSLPPSIACARCTPRGCSTLSAASAVSVAQLRPLRFAVLLFPSELTRSSSLYAASSGLSPLQIVARTVESERSKLLLEILLLFAAPTTREDRPSFEGDIETLEWARRVGQSVDRRRGSSSASLFRSLLTFPPSSGARRRCG